MLIAATAILSPNNSLIKPQLSKLKGFVKMVAFTTGRSTVLVLFGFGVLNPEINFNTKMLKFQAFQQACNSSQIMVMY